MTVLENVNAVMKIDPALAAFPWQTGRTILAPSCASCNHPLASTGVHTSECPELLASLT